MIATSSSRTRSANACVVRSNNASCHRPDVISWRGGVGSRRSSGMRSAGVSMGTDAVAVMIYLWTCCRPCGDDAGRRELAAGNGANSVPELLARRILDLGLPRLRDQLDDVVGQRDVVQFLRHFLAVLERPVEELEHFLTVRGLVLSLVDKDEAGAGDRPRVLARLLGEHLVETFASLPLGIRCRSLERGVVRHDEITVLVLELRIAH